MNTSGASRKAVLGGYKVAKVFGLLQGLMLLKHNQLLLTQQRRLVRYRRIGLIVYRGQTLHDREQKA